MRVKELVYISLFAALMAAFALLPPLMIPLIGVPITAQSLGAILAGGIIGAKRGALAIALFLALVALGFPLLAGGRGGMGAFACPSGGFMLGWIVAAATTGWLIDRKKGRMTFSYALICSLLGGIVVLYPIGILWVGLITGLTFFQAMVGSMIFLIGDCVKVVISAAIIVKVKQHYQAIFREAL